MTKPQNCIPGLLGDIQNRGESAFAVVKELLIPRMEELCRELLPAGRRERDHWLVGDILGNPGRSLEVELRGPRTGLWLDRAGTEMGDSIDLIAAAKGLSRRAALDWSCDFLGLTCRFPVSRRADCQPRQSIAKKSANTVYPGDQERSKLRESWPLLTIPGTDLILKIAANRGLANSGLNLAVDRGILHVGTYCGFHCWILTDDHRYAAQARKIGGQRFFRTDGPKGISLRGTVGGWPIGLASLKPEHQNILMVEGGPDLLAAHCIIEAEGRSADTAAIAILGSSHRIAEAALPFLRRRRIRIFEHWDSAGANAVRIWTEQLEAVEAVVDFVRFAQLRRFDGEPVKDLNDFCLLHPDDFEAHRWAWEVIP